MPFEVVDQRGVSITSSPYPAEKQAGYLEPNFMPDYHGTNGAVRMPMSKSVSASPLGKFLPLGSPSLDYLEVPQSFLSRDGQKVKPHLLKKQSPAALSTFHAQPTSFSADSNSTNTNESSLFSSSFSEIFSQKLRLSANKFPVNQSAISVASRYEEKESFESLQEIEAQCIGSLLPDGDDLFYGVDDELGSANANKSADMGDFDLFSSGGGMELEGDDVLCARLGDSHFIRGTSSGQDGFNGSHVEQHPSARHPSRTLFVRNINCNVEDSELRVLFEKYGDIQVLYTACKPRGFVMISYYDIRAARNARSALQNKPLRHRKLDIHYSLPKENPSKKEINQGILVVFNLDSSLSNDDLRQKFGIYGEIKEIHETSHRHHHKFVEFYDVRAAEAALCALNGSHIAGKQIKLELSSPGGLMHCSRALGKDEPSLCQSPQVMANKSLGYTSMIDNGFSLGAYSIPSTLPSAVTVASAGSQCGILDSYHTLNHIKLGNPGQNVQPHSLPEYHGTLGSSIPYNVGSTTASITGMIRNQIADGMDTRHVNGAGSYEQLVELVGQGNGSSPLHVHGYRLGSHQHLSSSPMSWQNSPPFVSSPHTHRSPQLPGFPGAPFHMLPNMQSHHVGSAPVVNPSIWDIQHTSHGSPDASRFPLGSLGSVGFFPVSTVNLLKASSQNMLSKVGGNCIELSKNSVLHSPQQTCHMFPGRNPKISVPTSFNPPNERVRFRRNEAIFNQAEKKEFGLDIECILREGDTRTTLMIKNIPNKYTSKMLLAAIDEYHRGTYDFVYLPIDFKNKCNVGYAFINMTDPLQIVPFYKTFNGKKWEKFNSEKVATLAYARIQGKAALIAHFQNSSLMNEDKRCRPILFHTEGPNAGDQEPFPVGTNIRSRPGKPRTFGIEGSRHQGSPSTRENLEESYKTTDSSSTSASDQD